MVCSICKKEGHNKRTCNTNNIDATNDAIIDNLQKTITVQKKVITIQKNYNNNLRDCNASLRRINLDLEYTALALRRDLQNSERQARRLLRSQPENENTLYKIPEHIKACLHEQYKENYENVKETCPVCLEVIIPDNLNITNCGHKFCKECIDNDNIVNCPTCRSGSI